MRWTLLVLMAGTGLLQQACYTVGMYRTAHILPEGEGDFAMNFSYARITVDDQDVNGTTVEGTTVSYPNLVPELSYHIGLMENLEVGGRLALGAGMAELDVKYRFLGGPGSSLHLAVQPAVGYRSLGFIEGLHASLPVIVTKDLNDRISFNASVFGSYATYEATDDFQAGDDADLSGDNIIAGVAAGVHFETKTGFHVMPALEYQRYVSRTGSGAVGDLPTVSTILFGITFGWGAGDEYEQLDRIEQKLDKALEKPAESES